MTFHPRRIFCERAASTLLRRTIYDLLVTIREVGYPYQLTDNRWATSKPWRLYPTIRFTGTNDPRYYYQPGHGGDAKSLLRVLCSLTQLNTLLYDHPSIQSMMHARTGTIYKLENMIKGY